jgi:hypothetical protein
LGCVPCRPGHWSSWKGGQEHKQECNPTIRKRSGARRLGPIAANSSNNITVRLRRILIFDATQDIGVALAIKKLNNPCCKFNLLFSLRDVAGMLKHFFRLRKRFAQIGRDGVASGEKREGIALPPAEKARDRREGIAEADLEISRFDSRDQLPAQPVKKSVHLIAGERLRRLFSMSAVSED